MTRDEQLKGRGQFHDNTINILALWEAMDAATNSHAQVGEGGSGRSVSLTALRALVGTWELRDLAITLMPYVDQVWTDLGDEDICSFDWEYLPALVAQIDWSTAQSSPITLELPTSSQMAAVLQRKLNLQ